MILAEGQCVLFSGTVVEDTDPDGEDRIDVVAPSRYHHELPVRNIPPLQGPGSRLVPAKGTAVTLIEFPGGAIFYISAAVVSTQWTSVERVGFEGRGGAVLIGIESVLKEVHLGGFDAPEQATCWAPLKAIVDPHNDVLVLVNAVFAALENTLNAMVPGSGTKLLQTAGYNPSSVTTQLSAAASAISVDGPASDVVRILKAKPT